MSGAKGHLTCGLDVRWQTKVTSLPELRMLVRGDIRVLEKIGDNNSCCRNIKILPRALARGLDQRTRNLLGFNPFYLGLKSRWIDEFFLSHDLKVVAIYCNFDVRRAEVLLNNGLLQGWEPFKVKPFRMNPAYELLFVIRNQSFVIGLSTPRKSTLRADNAAGLVLQFRSAVGAEFQGEVPVVIVVLVLAKMPGQYFGDGIRNGHDQTALLEHRRRSANSDQLLDDFVNPDTAS